MPQIFYYEIYGNTVLRYVMFIGLLAAGWLVIGIAGHILFRHFAKRAEKTQPAADDLLVKSLRRYVMPSAYFAAFYLNTKILVIGNGLAGILNTAVLAFTTVMASLFVSSVIVLLFNKYWENKRKDANKELAVKTISGLLKIVVWSVAGILFLDNIGVKINTLIAGVGIGGIAIAFAAQSILGIFSAFSPSSSTGPLRSAISSWPGSRRGRSSISG